MKQLCVLLFVVGVFFLNSAVRILAQSSISSVMHPIPEWETEYNHHHYFTIGAGLLVSDIPAPPGFYFAYVTPDGKNIDGVHHMDLSSGGKGPGFMAQSGLDIALGYGFKITGDANLMFQRVSH